MIKHLQIFSNPRGLAANTFQLIETDIYKTYVKGRPVPNGLTKIYNFQLLGRSTEIVPFTTKANTKLTIPIEMDLIRSSLDGKLLRHSGLKLFLHLKMEKQILISFILPWLHIFLKVHIPYTDKTLANFLKAMWFGFTHFPNDQD